MTIKEFNNLEEIQKYYVKETNTYAFKENEEYIDLVVFNFDLNIGANIVAKHIKAHNIRAWNINAWNIDAYDITTYDIYAYDISAHDIDALDINANDINANDINADTISYYAVCFAYNNIFCKFIKGRKEMLNISFQMEIQQVEYKMFEVQYRPTKGLYLQPK